jgi:hypothetical protein
MIKEVGPAAIDWSRFGSFSAAGRDVQSDRSGLGFLGPSPFRRESPRLWGLEKLGFPWILFNGLRRIFAERKFLAPSLPSRGCRDGSVRSRPCGRAGLLTGQA